MLVTADRSEAGSRPALDASSRTRTDARRAAIQILRDAGMPPDEIRAVLAADRPAIARRYIELHAERLAERLAATLDGLETAELLLTRATQGALRRHAADGRRADPR